eukprot:g32353.t1
MGNFCASRTDPEESRRQYEKYTFLRQQIVAKLSDEVLANECGHLYAEDRGIMSKTESASAVQSKLGGGVPALHSPCPPDRSVSEATFVEFHRLMLTLAEEELRLRIAKVKEAW